MNLNVFELIGGFINEKMFKNRDSPSFDPSIYDTGKGLAKQTLDIGKTEFIKFFINLKVKDPQLCIWYDIIIKDIDSNVSSYKANDISDRLKKITGENFSLVFPDVYNKLLGIIDNLKKNPNINITDITDKEEKEFVIQLQKSDRYKTEIQREHTNGILDTFISIRQSTFYKLAIIVNTKILSKINKINSSFISEMKNLKSNQELSAKLYTEKRNDYMRVLLQVVPFLKIRQGKQTNDIFKTINNNKYIIYFKLDNLLYKIYQNLESSNDTTDYYYIDNEYQITKLELARDGSLYDPNDTSVLFNPGSKNIIDKEFIKMSNIQQHPDLINILLTKKNFEKIKKTLKFMYKYFKNDPDVAPLFDYMFIDTGNHILPKKKLVANILNLFILTGNLTLLYQLFNPTNEEKIKKEALSKTFPPIDEPSTKYADYKLTLAQLKIKDLPDKSKDPVKYCEKVNLIINELKIVEIEKIMLDKFKDFIITIDSLTENDTDENFKNIILALNNLEYDKNIPDEIIPTLTEIKRKLIFLLIISREQINKEILDATSSIYSSGIDLVNSYNFYDLLDNCKELDKKITEYTPGTKHDFDVRVTTINNIIKRKKGVTRYFLLLEVVNLKRLFNRAARKLGYPRSIIFNFGTYLIDIFTVYRINQELEVPFNINLLTHKFHNYRDNISYVSVYDRQIVQQIYNQLEEQFINFSYGSYSRGTSDCGESTILNLINYLIWDKDTNTLRHDWLPENTIKGLKDFYLKNNTFTSFNAPIREQFNELLYTFEYIMQNTDYYLQTDRYSGEINFKVYSTGITTNKSYTPILTFSDAMSNFIYDEEGIIIPGKEEITYTGWRIKPGYISFVRLFNNIFGFNKLHDKYNENKVMRNANLDSLKEILLTFQNPNIQSMLDTYTVHTGRTPFDDDVTFSFNDNKVNIQLEWWHARIGISNSIYSDASYTEDTILFRYFSRKNLRYYINEEPDIYRIRSNPEKLLRIDPDILRIKIEELFVKCITEFEYIPDACIQVYKTIWAPEQTNLILNVLPSEQYLEMIPITENNLFKEFEGRIKLSIDFSNKKDLTEPIIDFIIYINNNDVNSELDKYGNRMIHILIKNNLLELFEKLMVKNPNYTLTDLFGNNLLHICKYSNSDEVFDKLESIKCILFKKTGNDDAFNKLIMGQNKTGFYPVIEIFKRHRIIMSILFPTNDTDMIKILANLLLKYTPFGIGGKFKLVFNMIFSLTMNRLSLKQTSIDFINKIFSFAINLCIKNRYDFVFFIDKLIKSRLVDLSEIKYLEAVNLYQFRKPYTWAFNEDSIISSLTYGKKYDQFNPWKLFNDFSTMVTFNRITTILNTNSLSSEFSKLGQIENADLIKQITDWASKKRNYDDILSKVDKNLNTIIHYLALGCKVNLENSRKYLKVFNELIKNKRFDILTMPNNIGWSPIDILAYIPRYPNTVFLQKLDGIRDQFKILINFYTEFTEDISNHKIILLRYMIEKVFVNINQNSTKIIYEKGNRKPVNREIINNVKNLKEVDDLITLLNTKLDNHESLNRILLKANKEFILHEYLNMFGKIAQTYSVGLLSPYYFRPYTYIELDGVRIIKDGYKAELYELSNKTSLNHVPIQPIKCIPKLTDKQAKKLEATTYKHLLTSKYIKYFIKEQFETEIIEIQALSPTIQNLDPDIPTEEDTGDQTGQDFGLIDPVTEEDPAAPVALVTNTNTKYRVQEKDYSRLYLKYKQKYLDLKNRLNK
jgi:hypothetical protein